MGDVQIAGEMVQTISEQGNQRLPKPASFCWVQNVLDLVLHHLEQLHLKGALTLHDHSGYSLPKMKAGLSLVAIKVGARLSFAAKLSIVAIQILQTPL